MHTSHHLLHCSFSTDGDFSVSTLRFSPITLTNSNSQSEFVVTAIDDIVLEDFEESLAISISLASPNVLAVVDRPTVVVTIQDNESQLQVESCTN